MNIYSLYEKCVCSECAGLSLGKYIKLHGECDTCDYCHSNTNFVMAITQILPQMFKSWELYFDNFDDSHFPEEFRTPYDISDIIDEEEAELEDASEEFLKEHGESVGQSYMDTILGYFAKGWVMPAIMLSSIAGGIIGGYIGSRTLKRHFERSGLL